MTSPGQKAKNQFINELIAAGFTCEKKRGGHWKITRPGTRGVVFTGSTPRSTDHKGDLAVMKKVFGWTP